MNSNEKILKFVFNINLISILLIFNGFDSLLNQNSISTPMAVKVLEVNVNTFTNNVSNM